MQSNSRGFLLITALLVVTGVTALISIGLTRSMTEILVTNRSLAVQQAVHTAEAGLDDAIAEYVSGGADAVTNFSQAEGWTDRAGNACNAGETCSVTFPLNTGTVTVTVNDIATSPATITSIGSSGGVNQTVEMVVVPPQGPLFQQAIFGQEGVHVHQGILVDSYDSTKGPYTPSPLTGNRNEDGDIRTNSTETNTVQLDQDVQIYGDVLVGYSGIPSVVIQQGQGVSISGEQTAYTNLWMPPIQVPAGTPCGGPLVVPTGTTRIVDVSTFCYSSINVAKDAGLLINGDGKITLKSSTLPDLATGQNSVLLFSGKVTVVAGEVSIGERLTLGTAASLKLYATDSVFLRGVINSSQDPKNFAVNYTGTSTLDAGQGTSFYGTIYAPNADVKLHQSGDFFGAVVAKSVDFDQSGRFHFDEALTESSTSSGSNGNSITIRSWRQP